MEMYCNTFLLWTYYPFVSNNEQTLINPNSIQSDGAYMNKTLSNTM